MRHRNVHDDDNDDDDDDDDDSQEKEALQFWQTWASL